MVRGLIKRLWMTVLLSIFVCSFFSAHSVAAERYRVEPEKSALLLSGGAILWTAGLYIDGRNKVPLTLPDISALSEGNLNPLDRKFAGFWSPGADNASDVLVAAMAVLPAALMSLPEISKHRGPLALMYAETFLFAMGGAALAKGMADRPRPFVYAANPDVPAGAKLDADAARSFYSQHTALAFAAAFFTCTVFSDYYPDSKWKIKAWAAAVGGAAAVGTLRIASGRHFPTDVITGAAVGGFTGYLIPRLHKTGGRIALRALLGINSTCILVTVKY